jgi:transposase InsO family protein
MDIHKNARLSFRSREELSRFVLERGATRKAAAAAIRVSVKTAGKWVSRFRVSGIEGLIDHSSRPHRSPHRMPDSLSAQVIELRREQMPGYEIARRTGASPATVSRILRGDGRLRGKRKHPGFLALHVAVDDHSRIAFTQMLPDQKAATTIGFLQSAVEFFASHGIQTRALLTDNGSCYRSAHFRLACQQMKLKHRRTRPYTPRTNGKAERFIQTALREWARAKHWPSSEQRDAQLKPWTDYYNMQRPHGSLSYKPPISRSRSGTTS